MEQEGELLTDPQKAGKIDREALRGLPAKFHKRLPRTSLRYRPMACGAIAPLHEVLCGGFTSASW